MDARQTRGGVRLVRSGTMYIGASADGDMERPNSESAVVECNKLREWSICRVQNAWDGSL